MPTMAVDQPEQAIGVCIKERTTSDGLTARGLGLGEKLPLWVG
jgi:hypothetical protein